MTEDEVTKESIQAEFRGWEAFQGVDRRWHARLRGAQTPVMVQGASASGSWFKKSPSRPGPSVRMPPGNDARQPDRRRVRNVA